MMVKLTDQDNLDNTKTHSEERTRNPRRNLAKPDGKQAQSCGASFG